LTEEFIQVCGKTIKLTEKVNKLGVMVMFMKVILSIVFKKETEFIHGKMKLFMMEIGNKISSTVKES
jgi:hypothetical protein